MGVLTQKRAVLFVAAVLLSTNAFGTNPSPRTGARMAWDTPNNVGILFGGLGPTDRGATEVQHDSNETWLWNGTRWMQRFPETTPPARSVHGMTYDTARSRVVMFGGRVAAADKKLDPTYLNDTWVYSNENWTRIESAENPSARQHVAMAYDRARDRVILYGGNVLDPSGEKFNLFSDTWEFDGTQWHRLIENTPKVAKPLMDYDATRNQMILIGLNETGTEKVMYRYNATSNAWDVLTPATMPTCVNDGHLVYQEHTGKLIFFGGVCATGTPAGEEVFEWDGSNWTKLTVSTWPRLSGQAVAYDPLRREVVAYGGTTALGSVVGSQTQLLRNQTFRQAFQVIRPTPRSQTTFETDPATATIYLYGGLDETGTFFNTDLWGYRNGQWFRLPGGPNTCDHPLAAFDTDRHRLVVTCGGTEVFEFDGTEWKTFANLTEKPDARRFSAMVYDPTLKKTVMYGGFFGTNYRNDTWTWDGTAWTEVDMDGDERPPNRGQMAMWYDPLQKKVILYAGIGRPSLDHRITRYTDMWAFNGSGWTKLNVTETPGMRFGPQVEVNPLSGKMLLFGGLVAAPHPQDPSGKSLIQFFANDTWEWDGAASKWTRLTTDSISPDPEVRENGAMAWDPTANRMVLFAGYAKGFYRSDLWEWNGQDWVPRVEQGGGRRRAVR